MCGHASLPLKSFEVIGHRANDIGRVVEQVNVFVAIKIDCKVGPTRWHKLGQSHSTRVAAFELGGIDFFLRRHDQKLCQFFGEKGLTFCGSWVFFREVKGQRAQGV